MPYKPHHKYVPSDMPQRPLTDDEMFADAEGGNAGAPLSDDALFGPGGSEIDPSAGRTWSEWGRDTIGGILPDELLAAGGTLLGEGSYDDNMKTVEKNRKRYDRPEDDRSLGEKRQGYALNLLDNMLFGYGDEVVAGAGSMLGKDPYDKTLKDVEAKHQRYRDLEDDWSAGNIGSGGAGFIAGTPIFNGMFKGARALVRGGRSIPSLLQGAPKLAEVPATAIGRTAEEIAALGLTGAAAGEVTHSGRASGDIGSRIASLGADAAGAPAATIAEGVGNALPRILLNTGMGAVAGAVAPAVTRGGQRLFNFMFRNPADKAARYLAEKFVQSGKTLDEFAAELETAGKSGKPIAPVDIAPQQVRDAGTAAARMPGEGRDKAMRFLQERQEGQGSRLAEDMESALGKPAGSHVRTAEQISEERAAAAKPHYDEAFANPAPVKTPKIIELTNRPSGREAMNRGLKMAQDEGIAMEDLVVRDANGNITGYTTKALHYAKMALDDMIDSAMRSGNSQAARNLTMLKNDLLAEMDRVNPAYGRARQIYSGHSSHMNALDAGRKAASTRMHPDQIESMMGGMTEAERDFFKQGFTQKIIEDIENAPDRGNAVNRIFGTKAKRDRLERVLGPEKFKQLSDRFGLEKQMYDTYADVTVGSPTAQRIAAQNDLENGINGLSPEAAMGIGKAIATGNIRHFLDAVGWTQFQYILQGIGQRTRAQIVKMLFSTDPDEVRAGLELIRKHYGAAQRFQGFQQNVGAAASANENARNTVGGATINAAGAAGGMAGSAIGGVNPIGGAGPF